MGLKRDRPEKYRARTIDHRRQQPANLPTGTSPSSTCNYCMCRVQFRVGRRQRFATLKKETLTISGSVPRCACCAKVHHVVSRRRFPSTACTGTTRFIPQTVRVHEASHGRPLLRSHALNGRRTACSTQPSRKGGETICPLLCVHGPIHCYLGMHCNQGSSTHVQCRCMGDSPHASPSALAQETQETSSWPAGLEATMLILCQVNIIMLASKTSTATSLFRLAGYGIPTRTSERLLVNWCEGKFIPASIPAWPLASCIHATAQLTCTLSKEACQFNVRS